MNQQRRDALRLSTGLGLAVAAGLLSPLEALAAEGWNSAAFDTKNLNDTVKALGGRSAVPSINLLINAPEIAENGAVVPISVSTSLPNVQQIAILVEKNPSSLAAEFEILAGTEANVGTRVKMGQSSNVHAVVKAGGKYYVATKEVKVTLGGCGG